MRPEVIPIVMPNELWKRKIKKEKKLAKQRRKNIKKPAPDELLKSAIREFCKELKTNKKKSSRNQSGAQAKFSIFLWK